jgi:hypothetical protein
MNNHAVILDIVTIVVMAAAVFYAARLNRSLTRARSGRAELIQLIANLTDAQSRAEASIQAMKVTAAEYELSLTKQIAISRGLVDELSMINDTGNTLASRLERLAPLARGNAESGGARYAAELDHSPLRAERPLTAAVDMKPVRAKPAEEKAPAKAQPTALQTSMRSETPVQPAQAATAASPDSRSRAERELFAAIETLRKGKPS